MLPVEVLAVIGGAYGGGRADRRGGAAEDAQPADSEGSAWSLRAAR